MRTIGVNLFESDERELDRMVNQRMKREEEISSGLRAVLHERGARILAGDFDASPQKIAGCAV
jgi:hypothetical protein